MGRYLETWDARSAGVGNCSRTGLLTFEDTETSEVTESALKLLDGLVTGDVLLSKRRVRESLAES